MWRSPVQHGRALPDLCTYVRVYIYIYTYIYIYACIYVFIDAYAFDYQISQRYMHFFFYYYLILNTNPISEEKIIYMCLPSVYTISHVFYSFLFCVFLYVCMYVSMLCQKWRNKTFNSLMPGDVYKFAIKVGHYCFRLVAFLGAPE